LAQAIAQAVILQGYRVLYRETHGLLDELADAVAEGTRKEYIEMVSRFRCLSSTTSACANSRTPRPRICWK